MEKILWGEGFSVGVQELDAQHKQIITIINTLLEMNNTQSGSEIISETLTKMNQYAAEHFNKEEQYMLDYGYPEYSLQKKTTPGIQKKNSRFLYGSNGT